MRLSRKRHLFVLGAITLACGSGDLTSQADGTANAVGSTVKVVTVSVAASLSVGASTPAVAVASNMQGAEVAGFPVTWSSSSPGVATISNAGIVTGIAAGSTTITAVIDGISGSAPVAVTTNVPVASIAVSTVTNPIAVGATSQASAIVRDASGSVLTGRVVTWTSSRPSIATVTAAGLIQGVAPGTDTIAATSEGKTATLLLTVLSDPSAVGSITVSASTNALMLNGQAQVTAVIRDAAGNVSSVQPVWTSSAPSRVTVTSGGLVTQTVGGSMVNVTISATAGGLTSGTVIRLTGHAPEVAPALPQVYLNTTAPVAPDVGGVVISVASGGNLQAALDNAVPGDVIELATGAVFTGNFILKNKGATTKWITIRPSGYASLPAQGGRMTPTIAASLRLPRIETSSTNSAVGFAAGANHYRITGIEIGLRSSTPMTFALVNTESATGQTNLSQVPSDIVIDRSWVHGSSTQTVRRCVALNSASSAVIDSYLSECHELGSDSQAIAIWNGPGPFKIVNNYLEAAGENIILGGNDPSISGLVPSDVEIRRNHLFKQPSWKGLWTVKNLLELKNAQRVLVEGNILQNSWTSGQNGLGVAFKSVNQNGSCSWCVTQDVTYRLNLLQNVGAGYNIGASPDNAFTTIHARRISITDNVATSINTSAQFDGDGRAFLIDGDLRDVVIAHNTTLTETHALVFGGAATVSFTARDNIFGSRVYAVIATGFNGGPAFSAFAPAGYLLGNVFIADPSLSSANFGTLTGTGGYPASNFFESGYSSTNVAFANYSAGDFSLLAASQYKGRGTDAADVGANVAALNAAVAGVIVP